VPRSPGQDDAQHDADEPAQGAQRDAFQHEHGDDAAPARAQRHDRADLPRRSKIAMVMVLVMPNTTMIETISVNTAKMRPNSSRTW
jgi:hypothetical protein